MMKQAILTLLVLSTATFLCASKVAQIIDEDQSLDIERVAEVVCDVTKGSGKQIGRAATIGKLADFFKSLSADHKLAKCRDQYGESVERLQQVLETGNGNVCGNDKLTVVEQFHRRYVSGLKKYKQERKANRWMAPKLIKLVFMHYAHKISSMCEHSAALEFAQIKEKSATDASSSKEDNQFMAQISQIPGISDLSKGYDSVFSLWSLLDKLPQEKSNKFSRYLNTGNEFRHKLTIAMQKASELRQVQDMCGQVMRPIYTRSLLGVLRLVDLGYYPEHGLLIEEVRETPILKSLLIMAQVCEILLPIAVVEDATLSPEQVAMIPKDQLSDASLGDSVHQKREEYTDVPENSLTNLQTLEVADRYNAKSLAKVLKKAVRKRDDASKLMFKSMINCFKTKIKSKIESLLLATGGGAKECAINEELSTLDETDLASLIEEESEDENRGLARRKRGVGEVLGRVALAFGYLVLVAGALVITLIYYAIFFTLVLGLDVIRKFFQILTGYNIKWIRNFVRWYNEPMIYAAEKYRDLVKNNQD